MGRIEEVPQIVMEVRLVGFDQQEVVPVCIDDLLTEWTLAEERVAGEDAAGPIDLADQARCDGQFGLGFGAIVGNRFLGEDEARVVADGSEALHDPGGRIREGLLAPARLAINRHAVTAAYRGSRLIRSSERAPDGGGHRGGIEPLKQPGQR